jgi:hypothetical protein
MALLVYGPVFGELESWSAVGPSGQTCQTAQGLRVFLSNFAFSETPFMQHHGALFY